MSANRFVFAFALLLAGAVALADGPGAGPTVAESPAALADTDSVPTAAAPAPVVPLASRIAAVVAAERSECREITVAIGATDDPAARLALIRRLEQTKAGAEAAILDFEAEAADAAGRPDVAAALRADADRLRAEAGVPASPAPAVDETGKGGRS